MRKVTALALLSTVVAAGVAAGARPGRKVEAELSKLAWMGGSWKQTAPNGAVSEEHWMAPQGGTILGMFRVSNGDKTSTREFEIIEETPEGVKITLQHYAPGLKPIENMRLELKASKIADKEVVFEGAGDVKKIRYALNGKTLDTEVNIERNGQTRTLKFAFQKSE